ncbi:MAG: hypothetical protein M0Z76_09860 [Gammaproteobacteria bacterium]|nr:hypothetical protein [Gammaproteobacteria bacterium]
MKKTASWWWILATGTAHAWRLSVGAGADWAQAPGLGGVLGMRGVSAQAVVSDRPFAGRAFAFVLGASRLATPLPARRVETITAWRGRCVWEWRLPLTYALRPWWGVGLGVDRLQRNRRYVKDALGYAQIHEPARDNWLPVWSVVAVAPLPARLAVQLSLASAVGPHPLSTVTVSLMWRIV